MGRTSPGMSVCSLTLRSRFILQRRCSRHGSGSPWLRPNRGTSTSPEAPGVSCAVRDGDVAAETCSLQGQRSLGASRWLRSLLPQARDRSRSTAGAVRDLRSNRRRLRRGRQRPPDRRRSDLVGPIQPVGRHLSESCRSAQSRLLNRPAILQVPSLSSAEAVADSPGPSDRVGSHDRSSESKGADPGASRLNAHVVARRRSRTRASACRAVSSASGRVCK